MYSVLMDSVKWRLKEFLNENKLNANQLADKSHGQLSRNGVYRLTADDLSGIRFNSLAVILPALRELTGREVRIDELLEITPPDPLNPKRGAWRRLRGALNDPDSPGDIAQNHGRYVGEALVEEHEEGLAGKR